MINEFFHIFSEDVRFQVHRVTNLLFPQGRILNSQRDQGHGKGSFRHIR